MAPIFEVEAFLGLFGLNVAFKWPFRPYLTLAEVLEL